MLTYQSKKADKKSPFNVNRSGDSHSDNSVTPMSGEKGNKQLKEEVKLLLKMYPGSSKFLGRPEYTAHKKPLGFIKKNYPDLTELRDKVNRFSTQEKLSDPRMQIKKLLKRFPAYPDLRALNAIQLYVDVSQSGLDAKKIQVLKSSLREITRALYNGGLSLFNVTWFIKIYTRYIDSLRDKYQHLYKHFSKPSRENNSELAAFLARKQIQLTVMAGIKSKLSSLEHLNVKLKDSPYIVSGISIEEVKRACQALKNGDGSKKIGESGKTAGNILSIIMTLNMLFVRIPIMKKLVENYLGCIPDFSREVMLQKIMIANTLQVTEFQLQMASGNKEKTREIALKLYTDQQEYIHEFLETGLLTRQYEIDPFVKTAWIAKESKGLFEEDAFRAMLRHAFSTINVLFGERVQVNGATRLAQTLQDDIQFLLIEAGWAD